MLDELKPGLDPALPYLEHYPEAGGPAHYILLNRFPFRIGRCSAAEFIIYSRKVSKDHAEIFREGEDILIRDLGSTNGTFVNGQKITETALIDGDIIHVAHKEFRFSHQPCPFAPSSDGILTASVDSAVPLSIIHGNEHLRELLVQHRVSIVFQPILHLGTREVLGYEALGRGAHDELSPDPCDLFRLAEHCQLAPELSRLFRIVALEEAVRLPGTPFVFFNVHPTELEKDSLLNSLAEVPEAVRANGRMVLEVHEDTVADTPTLRRLRDQIKGLGIGLAFDDFGSGQARLRELADVPPDFIKLDMALIRGIDGARARQELIQALSRLSNDLGVRLIAEGIETAEEADACFSLGCVHGQGFLFGRPQPVDQIALPAGEFASPVTSA